MNRYFRELERWEQHLRCTKQFIKQYLNTNLSSDLYVLGSGWLLDIPLSFLSENFERVYLVDLFHPRQVQHAIKRYANFELINMDITGGGVEQILKNRANPEGYNPVWELDTSSLYISLNILNQLDILILENSGRKFNSNVAEKFRQKIQQFHVDRLTKGSLLITDFDEYNLRNGVKTKKELIKCSLNDFELRDKWEWPFDHRGHYRPGAIVDMEVKGFVKIS